MINEKEFRDILRRAIADANNRQKTFKNEIKKMLSQTFNVTPGETVDILEGYQPVDTMPLNIAYKVCRVLYEINKKTEDGFNIKLLEVDKYFSKTEQEQFEKKIDLDKQIDDIVIDEWFQVEFDRYKCKISIDKMMEVFYNVNRLRYNEKTQRKLTVLEKDGIKYKKVTLVVDSLKQIRELMESNDFISDDLSLNINPEFYEVPRVVRGKLVIPKESVIDIIDGFHRYLMMTQVKLHNPDWEFPVLFNLMTYDEDKANQWIWQQDQKNHLDEDQSVVINKADMTNMMLNWLDNSSRFYLRGKLSSDSSIYASANKIVKRLFPIKTNQEAVNLAKIVEANINSYIEEYDYYDKEFTKEEWFMSFYFTNQSIALNKPFMDIIKQIKVSTLIKKLNFKKAPTEKDYKVLDEVMKNVQ